MNKSNLSITFLFRFAINLSVCLSLCVRASWFINSIKSIVNVAFQLVVTGSWTGFTDSHSTTVLSALVGFVVWSIFFFLLDHAQVISWLATFSELNIRPSGIFSNKWTIFSWLLFHPPLPFSFPQKCMVPCN